MISTDAPPVSSRVPFKWEEAAGKPIAPAAHTLQLPYAPEMMELNLQLPPKLQFPLPRSPLSLPHSPCERPPWLLQQSSPLPLQSPHSPSPKHHKLKRLYTYMLKNSPWSHPLPHPCTPSSWSTSACALTDSRRNECTFDERLFFDKALPKQFKYSVSLPDSWKASLPIHEEYKQGYARMKSEALSVVAMEEHEAESNASSPFHPIVFHERHGSACPWQAVPTIKASKDLLGDEDGDDEDEGFHDFLSTASSSLGKPSQTTDDSMESSCASPPPSWFLDFGPEELEAHEEKERSKLVVRLVAIVRLKKMISSKVCKLRKRGENHTSMWSPTLATYLFNEQNEEKEEGSYAHIIHDNCVAEEEEDDDEEEDNDGNDTEAAESSSMSSATSSHRFRINPDYHPPSSILRAHLQSDNDFFESEGPSSFRLQFSQELGADNDEEEELRTLSHRLSLREQLAEFDDEYPLESASNDQILAPQVFDFPQKRPASCKGMCKVRSTVKVLVASIKLVLVQTEGGKRKGQRPSLYGSCFKPNIPTLSTFPSTHNPKLHK